MTRRSTIALFGVLTLVGCENMGLEYAGTGEEGRLRAPTELVAAVHGAAAPVEARPLIANGRRWVPDGRPMSLQPAELRSVGSSGGRTLHAWKWDDAPYDMLFIRIQPGGEAAMESPEEPAPQDDTLAEGSTGASATAGSPGAADLRATTDVTLWQPLRPVLDGAGVPAEGTSGEH